MERDSEKTRQAILKAVGDLLAEEGFQQIGVNAIARRAGVDKVLIYRYFGSLSGLLAELGRSRDFWPDNEAMLNGLEDDESLHPAALSAELLNRHLNHMLCSPATREILRWELSQRNELTDILAKVREEQGIELMAGLGMEAWEDAGMDLAAIGAIIHAGLSYLAIRSDSADVYMGVDLTSEDGWDRIRTAIQYMMTLFLYDRGEDSDRGTEK